MQNDSDVWIYLSFSWPSLLYVLDIRSGNREVVLYHGYWASQWNVLWSWGRVYGNCSWYRFVAESANLIYQVTIENAFLFRNLVRTFIEFPFPLCLGCENSYPPSFCYFFSRMCQGHVAHLVLMISKYLQLPLRYPIRMLGSRSSIVDDISYDRPERQHRYNFIRVIIAWRWIGLF